MAIKKFTIDELDHGMTVADKVVDRSGRVLMQGGETINHQHMNNLRCWGVSHIMVEVEPVDVEATADDDEPACTIAPRFMLNDVSQPPFPILITICEEQIAEGYAP